MNILIVDDDFSNVSCLANLLNHDHKLRITSNSQEALNIFMVIHFDVVITDVEMPEMNGIELLKTIREMDERAYVIILTGNPSEEYKSESVLYNAYSFFTKPLNVNLFIDTLNRIEHEINYSKKCSSEENTT